MEMCLVGRFFYIETTVISNKRALTNTPWFSVKCNTYEHLHATGRFWRSVAISYRGSMDKSKLNTHDENPQETQSSYDQASSSETQLKEINIDKNNHSQFHGSLN